MFYALSLLISLLFVALTFVLARNLLKLICRTPPGRAGIEVPYAHGGGSSAALLRSGHGHVLVRLWPDEPLDR